MDTILNRNGYIDVTRRWYFSNSQKYELKEQVKQIVSVKRSESGIIRNPITLSNTSTAKDAKKLMIDNNIGVSQF